MRFKLETTKVIKMHNFTAFQGTFLDTEEVNVPIRIYANICNLDGPMESSEVYVYAHPFDDLYNESAYLLHEIGNEDELKEQLLEAWNEHRDLLCNS